MATDPTSSGTIRASEEAAAVPPTVAASEVTALEKRVDAIAKVVGYMFLMMTQGQAAVENPIKLLTDLGLTVHSSPIVIPGGVGVAGGN